MSASKKINYLGFGEDKKLTCSVNIGAKEQISQLRTLIKEHRPGTYGNVDLAFIWLYAVPPSHDEDEELPRKEHLEALDPLKLVGDVFSDLPEKKVHVLVWMSATSSGPTDPSVPAVRTPNLELQLWCHVDGDILEHIFPIALSTEASVGDLKNAIKEARQGMLGGVDAVCLHLHRAVYKGDRSKVEWCALRDPKPRLGSVFTGPLQEWNGFHVRVSVPSREPSPPAREDALTAITQSFLRLTTDTRATPSQLAKSGGYSRHQAGESRLLDGRFAVNAPANTIAPRIALFHPAFAQFSSMASDPRRRPSNEDVALVGELMRLFAPIYAKEGERQAAIGRVLGKVLRHPMSPTSNGDKTCPDFVAMSHVEEIPLHLVVGEEKKEFGDGSSDPSVQGAFSYLRVHSQVETKDVRLRCCCPGFIIAHAGPWLAVLGAVITGGCIVERLTDFIWVPTHSVHDERHCERLTQVLCALRDSMAILNAWYQGLKGIRPLNPEASPPDAHPRFFPTPSAYEEGGTLVRFAYERPLERDASCVTYLATTAGEKPKKIVVKFVVDYGEKAHRHMASIGCAPELLYCGRIDVEPGMPSYGDQRMVVMEHLEGHTLHDGLNGEGIPDGFPEDLEKAVKALHAAGYVFGDLRAPNVFITPKGPSTVRLIDFDWAGEEGKVVYPTLLSQAVKWPRGVEGRKAIERDHDLAMLRDLLEQANARALDTPWTT